MAAGFVVMAVRLVDIQAVRPARPSASEDTERWVARPARRGPILDAQGTLLAQSHFLFNLRADPGVIGTQAPAFAEFVGPRLGVPAAELLPLFTPRPVWRPGTDGGTWFTNRAVPVRKGVDPDVWMSIQGQIRTNFHLPELTEARAEFARMSAHGPSLAERVRLVLSGQFRVLLDRRDQMKALVRRIDELRHLLREIRVNGLVGDLVESRRYPLATLGAHVVGHIEVDSEPPARGLQPRLMGIGGMEARFDPELQGSAGHLLTRRARNRELSFLREREIDPRDGLRLRLTLDARIQHLVEEALDEGVRVLEPDGLVCLVGRPATGEILALANRPTFDPNQVGRFPASNLVNRAIVNPSEPGSTFKLLTYAAALDLGVADLDDRIDCENGLWLLEKSRPIRDTHGMKEVTVEEAFARSSNVGAAKLGLQVPVDVFLDYMRAMGFLRASGIMYRAATADLPASWGGEHPGRILARDRIKTEQHGRLCYGYGVMVTPLQTWMAASAIANGGRLMRPQLVKALEAPDGRLVKAFPPEVLGQAIKPETASKLRRAMRRVVTDGTGKLAALEDYDVAGKTGTAHKVDRTTKRQSDEKYISTFVGFFPLENPEVCILVLADGPAKRGGGTHFGGAACGPIFRAVAQQVASYLAVPPTLVATNRTTALAWPDERRRTPR
ncbi:MAG: peptidoglycan D,D-transpeptidase FtsI family protein [Verrucomicrobiota bacterium]